MSPPKMPEPYLRVPADPAKMEKRSVIVAGHQTSVSVENAFWEEFKSIANGRGLTVNQLVAEIDGRRIGNLSSAIRLFVLDFYKAETDEAP